MTKITFDSPSEIAQIFADNTISGEDIERLESRAATSAEARDFLAELWNGICHNGVKSLFIAYDPASGSSASRTAVMVDSSTATATDESGKSLTTHTITVKEDAVGELCEGFSFSGFLSGGASVFKDGNSTIGTATTQADTRGAWQRISPSGVLECGGEVSGDLTASEYLSPDLQQAELFVGNDGDVKVTGTAGRSLPFIPDLDASGYDGVTLGIEREGRFNLTVGGGRATHETLDNGTQETGWGGGAAANMCIGPVEGNIYYSADGSQHGGRAGATVKMPGGVRADVIGSTAQGRPEEGAVAISLKTGPVEAAVGGSVRQIILTLPDDYFEPDVDSRVEGMVAVKLGGGVTMLIGASVNPEDTRNDATGQITLRYNGTIVTVSATGFLSVHRNSLPEVRDAQGRTIQFENNLNDFLAGLRALAEFQTDHGNYGVGVDIIRGTEQHPIVIMEGATDVQGSLWASDVAGIRGLGLTTSASRLNGIYTGASYVYQWGKEGEDGYTAVVLTPLETVRDPALYPAQARLAETAVPAMVPEEEASLWGRIETADIPPVCDPDYPDVCISYTGPNGPTFLSHDRFANNPNLKKIHGCGCHTLGFEEVGGGTGYREFSTVFDNPVTFKDRCLGSCHNEHTHPVASLPAGLRYRTSPQTAMRPVHERHRTLIVGADGKFIQEKCELCHIVDGATAIFDRPGVGTCAACHTNMEEASCGNCHDSLAEKGIRGRDSGRLKPFSRRNHPGQERLSHVGFTPKSHDVTRAKKEKERCAECHDEREKDACGGRCHEDGIKPRQVVSDHGPFNPLLHAVAQPIGAPSVADIGRPRARVLQETEGCTQCHSGFVTGRRQGSDALCDGCHAEAGGHGDEFTSDVGSGRHHLVGSRSDCDSCHDGHNGVEVDCGGCHEDRPTSE